MTRACVVLCAALLGACASAPLPGDKPAALNPSNPGAPESKPLPVSTAFASEPVRLEDPGHGGHHDGHADEAMREGEHGSAEPSAAEYTCPMHPEVSNPGPGGCPKCGMALVPRKMNAQPGRSGDAHPPQEHDRHGEHEDRR